MENRPLVEVAVELGATDDQLRYWLKLAGFKPVKVARNLCLTAEMIGVMRQVSELVSHGVTPSQAVRQVGKHGPEPTEVVPVQVAPAQVDLSPLSGRLALIEKAIIAQIEQGNAILKENRLLREENRDLRSELAAIRNLLTAPATENPAEISFSDELRDAQTGLRDILSGIIEPFRVWFRFG